MVKPGGKLETRKETVKLAAKTDKLPQTEKLRAG
jgi:hypothetical protein